MSTRADAVKQEAEESIKSKKKLKEHVGNLSGSSRRQRQSSAAVLAEVGRRDPSLLVPYANDLVDALNRPEAQTRWEALDALTNLVPLDSRTCDKAVDGAEMALFDEDSGPLRLAAVRFLCALGATTENRSEKAWPLLDEAIQCYHGDIEFNEMMMALIDFANGKLSKNVSKQFAERTKFDAESGKGPSKGKAAQIQKSLKKKK